MILKNEYNATLRQEASYNEKIVMEGTGFVNLSAYRLEHAFALRVLVLTFKEPHFGKTHFSV